MRYTRGASHGAPAQFAEPTRQNPDEPSLGTPSTLFPRRPRTRGHEPLAPEESFYLPEQEREWFSIKA